MLALIAKASVGTPIAIVAGTRFVKWIIVVVLCQGAMTGEASEVFKTSEV